MPTEKLKTRSLPRWGRAGVGAGGKKPVAHGPHPNPPPTGEGGSPRSERGDRWIYLRVLGPFCLATAMLLGVSTGGFEVLSAARAYVGGESLWSKARSRAVEHLHRHAMTGDPAECARFAAEIDVTLGDRQARLELQRERPDLARARTGLLRGGNSPDDIARMIRLFRYFGDTGLMREAILAWAQGDALIDELLHLGRLACGPAAESGDANLPDAIEAVDARLIALEIRFSAALGEASREVGQILTGSTTVLALILAFGIAWLVRRSMREQLEVQRRLIEANERWDMAADADGIGVFVWDPAQGGVELDARARALHGLQAAEPARLGVGDLLKTLHPDDQMHVRQSVRAATQDPTQLKTRYRVRRPGLPDRHIEATAMQRAVESPRRTRLVGIVRDVTDAVASAELILEKKAAERVAQSRAEFLSRLSHELRTPLNAILGLTQLLEMDPAERLTPTQAKRVKIVLDSGWHLLRLVDDVLDITSIESGRLSLNTTATDLRVAMRASLHLVEPERAAFEIRIQDELPGQPAKVRADPLRLQQVLINLLSNACKYNRRGGVVTLGYREHADTACVTVADQGRGMSAAELGELFQPFKRLSPSAEIAGIGLGLVVVKLLVEQMGGSIEVQSRPGEGSRFTVCLQRA